MSHTTKQPYREIFLRGIISGFIAGAIKDLFATVLVWRKVIHNHFWNYAAILAFNQPPHSWGMTWFAVILELFFSTLVGYLYCLLLPALKTRHPLIQGTYYGCFVWFLIRCIVLTFSIRELFPTHAGDVIIFFFLSALDGFIIALINYRLMKDDERI